MHLLSSSAMSLFLLLFHFWCPVKAKKYGYTYHDCDSNSTFSTGSDYQKNLNLTLASLVANASQTGYYATSMDQTPNSVFGLIQCRGNHLNEDCQTCANTIGNQISRLCPNQKKSFIFNDACLLQYSDQRFFSNLDDAVRLNLWSKTNVNDSTLFNNMLGNLLRNLSSDAAANSARLAFGNANYTRSDGIYAVVQCIVDLARNDCLTCLQKMIANIVPVPASEGRQIFSLSCNLQYESQPFYQLSTPPPPLAAPPPPPPSPPPPSLLQLNSTPAPKGSTTNGGKSSKIAVTKMAPVAVVFLIIAITCGCLVWRRSKRKKIVGVHEDNNNTGKESLLIGLDELKAATRNFSDAHKLGEGGFGSVYKGKLHDGQEIAVKRLSSRSNQGMEEFKTEVMLVAKLSHQNLVRLLGFCLEEEKLLVYEYLPNGGLDKVLFDKNRQFTLEWERRHEIIVGIARGLLYLHQDSQLRIIHRDLKVSNILLDESMNPKISDFGLARLFPGSQTRANTNRIAGTYGYMAPEYVRGGRFSTKSDVFSFGIMVLEIVSGQKNSSFRDLTNIQSYAWEHWIKGTALQLLDPTLREQCVSHEVLKCIHLGLLCVQEAAADRPTMSDIVTMLYSYSVTTAEPQRPAFLVAGQASRSGSGTDDSDAMQSLQFSINEPSITELGPR